MYPALSRQPSDLQEPPGKIKSELTAYLRAISNTALRIRGALVAMYIMSATRLNDSTRARLTEACKKQSVVEQRTF
eukprot:scaffold117789_cov20-Tisochrysis_lutea.AAC.1